MGHYLATATIAADGQTAPRFSAGAYYAAFAARGDTLTQNQLQYAGGARGLPEPKGVTTAAVLAAAQSGLQECAALTMPSDIDDCPQQSYNRGLTDWSVQGDPVQGASAIWNGNGYWVVNRSVTMHYQPAASDTSFGDTSGTWQGRYQGWVIQSPSGPDAVYFEST